MLQRHHVPRDGLHQVGPRPLLDAERPGGEVVVVLVEERPGQQGPAPPGGDRQDDEGGEPGGTAPRAPGAYGRCSRRLLDPGRASAARAPAPGPAPPPPRPSATEPGTGSGHASSTPDPATRTTASSTRRDRSRRSQTPPDDEGGHCDPSHGGHDEEERDAEDGCPGSGHGGPGLPVGQPAVATAGAGAAAAAGGPARPAGAGPTREPADEDGGVGALRREPHRQRATRALRDDPALLPPVHADRLARVARRGRASQPALKFHGDRDDRLGALGDRRDEPGRRLVLDLDRTGAAAVPVDGGRPDTATTSNSEVGRVETSARPSSRRVTGTASSSSERFVQVRSFIGAPASTSPSVPSTLVCRVRPATTSCGPSPHTVPVGRSGSNGRTMPPPSRSICGTETTPLGVVLDEGDLERGDLHRTGEPGQLPGDGEPLDPPGPSQHDARVAGVDRGPRAADVRP